MATEQLFASAVQHAKACIGLKIKQVDVLKTLYQGKDCFMWFPTGYGKSLHYQLQPFLFDHKCGRIGASEAESSFLI